MDLDDLGTIKKSLKEKGVKSSYQTREKKFILRKYKISKNTNPTHA